MVILPVDQGFEHGPARSFAPNPPGYDPGLPCQPLPLKAGLNAHAAPSGLHGDTGSGIFRTDTPYT